MVLEQNPKVLFLTNNSENNAVFGNEMKPSNSFPLEFHFASDKESPPAA
jgi:hypothetical protein